MEEGILVDGTATTSYSVVIAPRGIDRFFFMIQEPTIPFRLMILIMMQCLVHGFSTLVIRR